MNEQELLQRIAEVIETNTKMVLDPDTIKGLLLEVQREQLKGLVYRAFLAVTQGTEQAEAVASQETAEVVEPEQEGQ